MPALNKRLRDQIYRLHISLPGTEPLVWRRILVPGSFSLEALHSVLQFVMGWQMCHLYEYEINGKRYSEPDESGDLETKPVTTQLSSTLRNCRSFIYTYDFGDGWQHDITVEAIENRDDMFHYPICIGGENTCPPEDCGSLPGYAELKNVIAHPKHPEYEEMMRWLGGYFDPRSFDANRINRDMLWMVDWKRTPNDQGLYRPFNFDDDE